nr:MAG TPA: terminase large subunit [Caudoviricetes sp.]
MADARVSALIAPAFLPLHRDIRRSGHAEYWLRGGRGSCKSSFAATEIVLGMLRDPLANAIVYRKVAATLRESVYEELTRVIRRMGLEAWFRFRVSPMQIVYQPTGQRILFRGADDPAKSKSIALSRGYFGFLWFEELSEFAGMEDVRTIRASVIRGAGSDRAVTLCSYNPPRTAAAWVNAEALVPKRGRLVHESSYLSVPRAWLGEAFIAEAEALRDSNERAYRHIYLGEITGTGGQVFDNLSLRAISDAEIAAFDTRYCGLDFGFAVDPDAFVVWHYDPARRRLVALDEYYGTRTPLDALADKVRARVGRAVVTCDSAEPRMIAELQRRGVQAVGARKGPGSVEHGMRWLQELGEIVIDPARCPNTAREFSGYEYRQDRHGNFLADYPDQDDHTIDATRYAVEALSTRRRLRTMDKAILGL